MELELIKEPKKLTLGDIEETSKSILNNLLEKYDAVTSFVMLKQMVTAGEKALEKLKEMAMSDNVQPEVLGADVRVIYRKNWKYNSKRLADLLIEEKILKSKIKNIKEILELSGTEGTVNQDTGDIETAELESTTGYITIKFKQ